VVPRVRHLLLEKNGRPLFLVTVSASGEGTEVSVVCLRESTPAAAETPRFLSKVWAEVASNKCFFAYLQWIVASSNNLPGGEWSMFMKVAPGFGNKREDLYLRVSIDKLPCD
jgi:hypothetical protein